MGARAGPAARSGPAALGSRLARQPGRVYSAFFRRGTSGAGREILSGAEIGAYHARAARMAPPGLLAWLHSGRPGAAAWDGLPPES